MTTVANSCRDLCIQHPVHSAALEELNLTGTLRNSSNEQLHPEAPQDSQASISYPGAKPPVQLHRKLPAQLKVHIPTQSPGKDSGVTASCICG